MKYKVYKKNEKGSYEQVEVTYNKEDLRKYIGLECQVIRYDDKTKTDDVLSKNDVEKEIGG